MKNNNNNNVNADRNSVTAFAAVLLALSLGTSSAGELKGRVVTAKDSGPTIVFLRGIEGGEVPRKDAVITHLAGGKFEPDVAIGFVGSDFVFRNEDGQLHTTHLYLHLAYQEQLSRRPIKNGATLYNIALPKKGMEVRRPIRHYHEFSDDTGLIDVRCNPHPDEAASALVFDHPYVASTAADGSFTIPNVPPGRHELWVWHGGEVKLWKAVDVKGSGATEIKVEVEAP